MSLIDADSRMSFHLQGTQTVPVHILHDHNLTLPDWYGAVVKKHVQEITTLTSYVVANAFFSKKGFVDQLMEMNLHTWSASCVMMQICTI